MKYNCKVFRHDCSPSDAEDKSLPTNSYLVKYVIEGYIKYDIAISHKRVEIFDYYYDLLKDDENSEILSIEWTSGRINPRLWNNPNDKKQEKKKK
jgi:hypothetical protein